MIFLSFLGFGILGGLVWTIGNTHLFLIVNREVTPVFGQTFRWFSALGESIPMGFLVVFYLFKSFRFGLTLAFSWLLGSCFSWTFKYGLAKNHLRPEKFFLNLNQAIETVPGVKVHHYHSFPSGHTLTVFTLAFVIPYFLNRISGFTAFLLWFLAFGCGISRIVLAQHWPVDVLAGMSMGILAGLISVWISVLIPDFKWANWRLKFWGVEKGKRNFL